MVGLSKLARVVEIFASRLQTQEKLTAQVADAIESVLLGVPGIREAAVFGVPDEYGKHVVHAAIVTDGDIQLSALQTAFGRQPGVPPPSVTLRIRRLPRNAAGKVVRADLVRFVQAMRAKGRP